MPSCINLDSTAIKLRMPHTQCWTISRVVVHHNEPIVRHRSSHYRVLCLRVDHNVLVLPDPRFDTRQWVIVNDRKGPRTGLHNCLGMREGSLRRVLCVWGGVGGGGYISMRNSMAHLTYTGVANWCTTKGILRMGV